MRNYHAIVNNNQSALIERLRYRQKPRRPASALSAHLPLCPWLVYSSRRNCISAHYYWRITSHQNTNLPHQRPSETSLAAPELFTAVVAHLLITHSITYSLLLCLFSLFPQFHPPHYTTDPSQIPQRWATTRLTPWRLTPSALSRYVCPDNLNGFEQRTDGNLRLMPPSPPTLATPVRPWAWPQS
jgi:hypothetical protein